MKNQVKKLRRALVAFAMTGAILPITDLYAQVQVVDSQGDVTAVGANLSEVRNNLLDSTAVISSDIIYEPGDLKIYNGTSSYYQEKYNPVMFTGNSTNITIKSDQVGVWRTLDFNGQNRLLHVVQPSEETTINFHGEDIIIKNAYGEYGQKGAFIAANSGTNVVLTGNMQFVNCGSAFNSLINALGGSITVDGTFVFDGIQATEDTGAIFNAQYNSNYGAPVVAVSGNNIFTNNYAKNGSVVVNMGGVRGDVVIEGTNVFSGNSADRGSAVIEGSSRGVVSISGTTSFNNNTVAGVRNTGPGVAYTSGSVVDATNLYISGTTEFKDNAIAGKYGAGAINATNVYFEGDNSSAVFSGNTFQNVEAGSDAVASDLRVMPVSSGTSYSGGLTSFAGSGSYSFGGGIDTYAMSISSSSVSLEAGAQSSVSQLTLSNGASLVVDMTNGSAFDFVSFKNSNGKEVEEMGVSLTDDGSNSLEIIFDAESETSGTLAIANASVLSSLTSPLWLTLSEGGENKRLSIDTFSDAGITWELEDAKNFVLYRKDANSASNLGYIGESDTLTGLTDIQSGDFVAMTNDGVAGGTQVAPDKLTIRSDLANGATLSGETTILSNVENLTLSNVTLKTSEETDAPVIAAATDKDVTITAQGNAGLSGKTLVDSNLTVAGVGSLKLDGALGQDLTVKSGASAVMTENTTVDGALTVDGANIFESVDADGVNVGGGLTFTENGQIIIAFDEETVPYSHHSEFVLYSGNIGSQNVDAWDVSIIDSIAKNMETLPLLTLNQLKNGNIVLSIDGANSVPEPASWALLVLGGLGLYGLRRNRKNK